MTLAAKAARGAGAPPAQAAAFGTAALGHLGAGCAADDLRAALDALPGGPILALPVKIARWLEDAEGEVATTQIEASQFAALELSYIYAQPFAVNAKTVASIIHVQMFLTKRNKPSPMLRVEVPDALAAYMQALGARILVPESDASRLSGAGAGLTDND